MNPAWVMGAVSRSARGGNFIHNKVLNAIRKVSKSIVMIPLMPMAGSRAAAIIGAKMLEDAWARPIMPCVRA